MTGIELARHDAFEAVERQVDAMVGEPTLREIVGADAFRPVAGADLGLAVGGADGVDPLPLQVVEPRFQHLHRLGAVLVLRALVLREDDGARRNMRDAHRALGLVDMLAAGAAGPHRLDPEVLVVDGDIHILGERQHGHGRGGGVDAPLRLGRRHPLHAMHAGFELETRIDAVAGHFGDDFLEAAHGALALGDGLDAPAPERGVALVHPVKVAGEERGLVAAGAGADLEDDAAVVGCVLGQQRDAQPMLQRLDALGQRRDLGFGERAHLGIRGGIREEPGEIGLLGLCGAQFRDGGDERRELGLLARKPDDLLRWRAAVQARLHLGGAARDQVELVGGELHGRSVTKLLRPAL